ncbi:hypothetical protein IHN63_06205 [Deinococcus sp. 6YEL10]|uniref:hypothetical protein n=1 Tax=Deinococcus sp. 6YEL10 TaxID=2745870 RepID=UPI001E2D8E89|nr:hypothetical protein [Deinococcus sp. 6YEL10]MCD0160902.1 hypothetical protein [Deinococcus sp. 6YEL10]
MTAAAPPAPTPAPAAVPIHPEAAALLIGEQRGRTGYRSLLQYAHELHQQEAQAQDLHETLHDLSGLPEEDDDRKAYDARYQAARAELEVTRQQAQQHARRMIRSSAAAREHHEYLAALLLDTARQEALQRPLRAAQLRAAPPRTMPRPPGPADRTDPQVAFTIDPVQILDVQRHEHNAIAVALLTPPTGRDSRLGTTADPDTQTLIDADQDRRSHALLACRYLLAGQDTLARHHASLATDAEGLYRTAHATITRDRHRGRRDAQYSGGDTWTAHLPDHDTPDLALSVPFTFELELRWNDAGLALTVPPDCAANLEARTGIRVRRGWHSLARWILDEHARHAGEGSGRRPNPQEPIWRTHHGRLTLRPHLTAAYPDLLAALEALRVTLRPAP